jgi:hypothetical protein
MGKTEHPRFAASWPAMIAGAVIAIVVSLALLALGSELGFTTISAEPDREVLGTTIVVTTAIWLIVTQWISAGLGGYVAGRLRTRWTGTRAHGIFFRDSARGLVTWAVATVVIAALVGPSLRSMIAGSAPPPAAVAPQVVGVTDTDQANGYRTVGAYQILGNTLATGSLPIVDRIYASGMEAVKAGVSGSNAARETATQAAIYTAVALLIGAYTASLAAALGGRVRDDRH